MDPHQRATKVISEEILIQILTVCLYLCVQCPNTEKR